MQIFRGAAVYAVTSFIVVTWAWAIDYEPIKLEYLLLNADAIVHVELPVNPTKLHTVKIREVFFGKFIDNTFRIEEITKWRRKDLVFENKEAILFLRRDPSNGPWQVIGPNGEGRIPINRQYAYAVGINIPTLNSAKYEINKHQVYATRVERELIINLLQGIGRCLVNKETYKTYTLSGCTNEELETLSTKSKLHGAILKNLR